MDTTPAPDYPFLLPDRYYGRSPWVVVPPATLMMLVFLFGIGFLNWWADSILLCLLLLMPLLPLLHLFSTPFIRVIGGYRYYSPLFLTFGETPKYIQVHSGPGLDYLLTLRGLKPGEEIRRTVLSFYLQGLLNIAAKVETREDPAAVTIEGSSWFFSDRSVERMGFTVTPATWFQKSNMVFSFVELALLASFSAGRPTAPNVFSVKKASMTGQDLLDHRAYIRRLYDRMATDRNRQYEVGAAVGAELVGEEV